MKKIRSALKLFLHRHHQHQCKIQTNDTQIKPKEAFFLSEKLKRHRINKSKPNENKVNSLDKHSKVSHHVMCDSKFCCVNKCPHRNDQVMSMLLKIQIPR